ncbi:hypothetical protein GHT06_018427 [Daphnia sinensis]|uniref:Uncharacterized protein n=1 Tax=Daphnia sinensis TaxID=1820382 RepID=A0AAD5LDW4_9CRUS|nr:hypothetical protein GHT06_018427 [Daphnia sinensis]
MDVEELVDEEVPPLVGDETHGSVPENELLNEQTTNPAATLHNYFYRTRSGKPYSKSLGLAAALSDLENTVNIPEKEVDEPQSFREAQQSKHAEKWMAAIGRCVQRRGVIE